MFSSPDPKKTFLDLGDGPSGDENNGFFRHLKKNAGDEKNERKTQLYEQKKGFGDRGTVIFVT